MSNWLNWIIHPSNDVSRLDTYRDDQKMGPRLRDIASWLRGRVQATLCQSFCSSLQMKSTSSTKAKVLIWYFFPQIFRLFQEAEDIDPERLRAGHPEQGLSPGPRLCAHPAVREATVARVPAHAASQGESVPPIIKLFEKNTLNFSSNANTEDHRE